MPLSREKLYNNLVFFMRPQIFTPPVFQTLTPNDKIHIKACQLYSIRWKHKQGKKFIYISSKLTETSLKVKSTRVRFEEHRCFIK